MPLTTHRLPLLLTVIVGAAMVGVTAWQIYSFYENQGRQATASGGQQLERQARDLSQAPDVDLTALTLFGTATSDGEAGPVDTENLPETNLRLFLRGVMAADGEFPGSALIEDQKGNTEAYPVGDELPGNAKLRSVHPNRVVIERGGKLENLFFPEEKNRSGLNVASSNQPEPQQRSAPAAQPPSSNQTSSPAADEQRREEIRRRLEQLRERLRNNSN